MPANSLHSISKARQALNDLHSSVSQNTGKVSSNFYGCKLICIKSAANSALAQVCKIQSGNIDQLTHAEKVAMESLKKDHMAE